MLGRPEYHLRLASLLKTFPAVAVLGPRQAGKSTLVRDHALGSPPPATRSSRASSNVVFFDLERPGDVRRLELAVDEDLSVVQRTARLVCIDEVQRLPSLFGLLRVLLDDPRRKARYILLGSASPDVVRGVSETLAGRIGFLDLTPFLVSEVEVAGGSRRERHWVRGGLPRSFLARSDAASVEWRESYVTTFLERDVPALGAGLSPSLLRRLWTMVAHLHGGILNSSEIASGLSVSAPTVVRYLDLLEGTFMVRRLPPYWANVGKRLVKAPKVYLRDSGLLHTLLGVADREALRAHPKLGASWEGWVIEQVLSTLVVANERPEAFFWRTHGGAEVDLLLTLRGRPVPFEVKLGTTPSVTRGLTECMKDLGIEHGFVLYGGDTSYPLSPNVQALPASLLADPKAFVRAVLKGGRR
jgi:uncharacterized protein